MMKSKFDTALMIVDFQKAIDHPSWGQRNNPNAEANVAALLAAWRETGCTVIHVRHLSREPDSTYRPGQKGCEFKDEVAPLQDERVIDKHVNSAFIGTELEPFLKGAGITSLVICGVITNNSVETTARMAGNLGYRTTVVSDATATFGKTDFNGRHWPADDVHALSLANLQGEYADIRSTAEVLESLR